ncbi:MAG: 50S ribosomal protein L6 [Clostridia bacterium]
MSRIGNKHIPIPAGVEVKIAGSLITVKGPKGVLSRDIGKEIVCKQDGSALIFTRPNEEKETRAKHGLYRALVNNMVVGVTTGFSRTLVTNGIGYRIQVNGNKLVLNIGYSHPIEIIAPAGIKIECPNATDILVSGIDKELVGQVSADIKAERPVEPYHAYGIRYKEEVVVLKEGKKTGK